MIDLERFEFNKENIDEKTFMHLLPFIENTLNNFADESNNIYFQ